MSFKERLSTIFKKKEKEGEITLVGVNPQVLERVQSQRVPLQTIPQAELIAKPEPKARVQTLAPEKAEVKPTPAETPKPVINPDPPKPKETKTVLGAIQEKKKKKVVPVPKAEEKKEVVRLSFDDAVEKYELERLTTHQGKEIVLAQPQAPARFTREEINKFLIIKVMPSFIRSILANRSNVKFMVYCGIFQYEFIKVVADREEGRKFMLDLKEALDFDSVMEVFPRRNGEAIVIYSRKHTDLRGRYSGTPLRPRLLERS